jgi:chemotaxis signal transduction protein
MVAVPGGRSGLAGVALARGLALPVYDLRGLVGAGTSTGRSRAEHVIVCDWGEVSVGILGGEPDLLDGVPERADPAEGGIMSGTCGAGLLTRGGEVVTVLDAARLFASLGVPEDGSTDAREAEGEDDPAGR